MSIESRVTDLVMPIVDDLGLVLFDLEYGGGRLKVTLDHDEGVDSGTLTLATRQLSRALDAEDPISGSYTLEVTTPGIERKLRRPEHWKRSITYDVAIKLREELPEFNNKRRVTGVIVAASDTAATLQSPEGDRFDVAYDLISKAKTVFAWGPPEKGDQTNKNQNNKNNNGKNKNAGSKNKSGAAKQKAGANKNGAGNKKKAVAAETTDPDSSPENKAGV